MNLASYVRASYALGYAETEAEITDIAKDQCAWLMSVADPQIVEVARSLAAAQGRWTYHNTRRDALYTRFQLEQRPLLAKLAKVASPKLARIMASGRPAGPSDVTPQRVTQADGLDSRMGAGILEADQGDVLRTLQDSIDPTEWRSLLQEAWINAKAEGNTEAMAMISAATNAPMMSMDVEFPQFLDALKNLGGDFAPIADSWVNKQLEGMAYYIAQDVSDALANGATYDALLTMISDGINSGDASGLVLDHMISTGVSEGSLDQYQSEGVDQVDILVSPDCCDECSGLEDQNPWQADDADGELPAHFNCRCALAPHIE